MHGKLFLAFVTFFTLTAVAVSAQDGYKGPGSDTEITTVEQAKKLKDDAQVVLKGTIDKKLGGEKYLFSDSSGSIIIEIDDHLWRGLSADQNDTLEITGEVDRGRNKVEIEAHSIKKSR
ncbi:MAG: NirD/YgiW/YdeI family stress tolerance protein [Spirochaetaceae bacterium]|jgi:uncharacterized protein (TIGR00156 family)|nr:NirD/YgiW/YdeI family stress tolerance protein [Spirochaetaceae bacterium]